MRYFLGSFITFFIGFTTPLFACTDIRLIAQDGTVLVARSMEFAMDLQTDLISSPRGRQIKTTTPNNKPGMTWKNQYGYVFLDGFHLGVPVDGMNEQGLSIEALLFPNEAKFQVVPDGKESQGMDYLNFGDWVLGNFKTIEEVKQALPSVIVFSRPLPQLDNTEFPLHYAIYDSSGKGIIVEYRGGNLYVYDSIGVLTNSPSYDWHTTNIRNYLNLMPANPKPVVASGITYAALGQGSGMLGLPGDISPPSRFIKMAVMLKTAYQPNSAADALNLSQHIMNNVDIPLGFSRTELNNNTATDEKTQWVIFKDLTHKYLYYRTYNDLTVHAIDLAKVNFAEGAPQLKMSIASPPNMLDMNDAFNGVKH